MAWASISITHAATLDVPRNQSLISGIGVIHGWKCQAGQLTVRFDGGPPLPLLYGAQRKDVQRAGSCAHANVGFVSVINWGELGDGTHTAVVYDDGAEFTRSTFTVVTTGTGPWHTGNNGECVATDFPDFNQQATFVWSQATQGMELHSISGMGDDDLAGVSDTDLTPLEFLLDRERWVLEVTGVNQWKTISHAYTQDPNKQGDQLIPAPAGVWFDRWPTNPGHKMPWERHYRTPVEGAEIVGRIYGRNGSQAGTERILALGGILDMLPQETVWQIGLNAFDDHYALVVQVDGPTQTYHPSHCYILLFHAVSRTVTGGMDSQAHFVMTEKEPDGIQYKDGIRQLKPGACVPPISPMVEGRLTIY